MHSTQSSKIIIALLANWDYVTPLETTIKSIAAHNRNCVINIINPDIPREWFSNLNRQLAPLNIEIKDIKISTDILANQHLSQAHLNLMANARLLLPNLIKNSRVLYLDSDIIVQTSLRELFDLDLKGHPLAAAKEIDGDNFNSGVMLLDLNRLRQIPDIVNKLLKYGERPDLENGDETVMNHFFGNDYIELPPIYNLQIGLEKPWEIAKANGSKEASAKLSYQQEIFKLIPKAVIIHYLTSVKPWNLLSYNRCRELWWQYQQLQFSTISSRQFEIAKKSPIKVLAWSDTDNLPHLEELLKKMPEVTINLLLHGTPSSSLLALMRYPNLRLYPYPLHYYLEKFPQECQVYLDLNVGNKNIELMQQIINRQRPILAFAGVGLDQLSAYPHYHEYQSDQVNQLIRDLRTKLQEN